MLKRIKSNSLLVKAVGWVLIFGFSGWENAAHALPCDTAKFEGFSLASDGKSTLAITKQKDTWQGARDTAKAANGRLVVITSEQQNAAIVTNLGGLFTATSAVTSTSQNKAWINLLDPLNSPAWSIEGSAPVVMPSRFSWGADFSAYQNWASGQPDGYCTQQEQANHPDHGCYGEPWVAINTDGKWSDEGNHSSTDVTLKGVVEWPQVMLDCVAPVSEAVETEPEALPGSENGDQYCTDSTKTLMTKCLDTTDGSKACPNEQIACNAVYEVPTCPPASSLNTTRDMCQAAPVSLCGAGYTWDSSIDKCVASATCSDGGVLNPVTDKCEKLVLNSCPDTYSYDSNPVSPTFGRCVKPVACVAGSFNPATDRCEASATSTCPDVSYALNPSTGTCEKAPACSPGMSYHPAYNLCTAAVTLGCGPGYAVNPVSGRCEKTPECSQGSYNPISNICGSQSYVLSDAIVRNLDWGTVTYAGSGNTIIGTAKWNNGNPVLSGTITLNGTVFTGKIVNAACTPGSPVFGLVGEGSSLVGLDSICGSFTYKTTPESCVTIGGTWAQFCQGDTEIGFCDGNNYYTPIGRYGCAVGSTSPSLIAVCDSVGGRLQTEKRWESIAAYSQADCQAVPGSQWFSYPQCTNDYGETGTCNAEFTTSTGNVIEYCLREVSTAHCYPTYPSGAEISRITLGPSGLSGVINRMEMTLWGEGMFLRGTGSQDTGYILFNPSEPINPTCTGGSFDGDNDVCFTPYVTSCAQGNYDGTSGLCVATASCPGAVLNTVTDKCEATPAQDCGTLGWDSSAGVCYSNPVCSLGAYDAALNTCTATLTSNCGTYSQMDATTCQAEPACASDPAFSLKATVAYTPALDKCVSQAQHDCVAGTTYIGLPVMQCEAVPICANGLYLPDTNTCYKSQQTCPLGGEFQCHDLSGDSAEAAPGVPLQFCSPNACQSDTSGWIHNTDTESGLNDKKNDGDRSADGKCLGNIYLYNGTDMRCRKADLRGATGAYLQLAAMIALAATGAGAALAGALGASAGTVTASVIQAAVQLTVNTAIEAATTGFDANNLLVNGIAAIAGAAAGGFAQSANGLGDALADTVASAGLGTGVNALADPALSNVIQSLGNIVQQYQPAIQQGMLGNYSRTKCCYPDTMSGGCYPEEFSQARMAGEGACHMVGEYCATKALSVCMVKKQTNCCFSSKLGRIFHEQGRPQLTAFGADGGWGPPRSPNCRGFTPEEFQSLNFGSMDLSEYVQDIEDRMQGAQPLLEQYMNTFGTVRQNQLNQQFPSGVPQQ